MSMKRWEREYRFSPMNESFLWVKISLGINLQTKCNQPCYSAFIIPTGTTLPIVIRYCWAIFLAQLGEIFKRRISKFSQSHCLLLFEEWMVSKNKKRERKHFLIVSTFTHLQPSPLIILAKVMKNKIQTNFACNFPCISIWKHAFNWQA